MPKAVSFTLQSPLGKHPRGSCCSNNWEDKGFKPALAKDDVE